MSTGNAANAGIKDDAETLQTLSSMVKNNDQNIVVSASTVLSASQKTVDRAKVSYWLVLACTCTLLRSSLMLPCAAQVLLAEVEDGDIVSHYAPSSTTLLFVVLV